MKLTKYLLALSFALFSANASALLLSDVGSYDTLVDSEDSGAFPNPTFDSLTGTGLEGSEEEWIEGVLGFQIDLTKYDGVTGAVWEAVTNGAYYMDGDDVVYTDYGSDFLSSDNIGVTPDYYLLKVGTAGSGLDPRSYLFQNNVEFGFGFINLSDIGGVNDILSISHISAAIDPATVPEPGIVALLGLGLLGMVVTRRKMKV